jgi:chromosome segregation ATPase
MAGLAWMLCIVTMAGAAYALYRQGEQMVALRQEGSSRSAELSSLRGQLDRQTHLAERKQAELDALHRNASASTQSASALDAEAQRLRAELDATRAQLKDAENREVQARTRWAYAEGERDALFGHLNALLERFEHVLKNAEPPVESMMDADPPVAE